MRMRGFIRLLHKMPETVSRYGGGYGVIVGDDDKPYTFNGGNIFRNMSHPFIDAEVTFEVVGYGYATNIDVTEKGNFTAGGKQS